jgi:hypothetical protein
MHKNRKPKAHKAHRHPACDCCKRGFEAMARAQREAIDRQGWAAHVVFRDDATDYHTHGLVESFECPDIQFYIFTDPLALDVIARRIVDRIKAGTTISNGMLLKGVYKIETPSGLVDFGVRLIEAIESERTVLRVILPDRHGCLDRGAEAGFAEQWEGTVPEVGAK